MYIKTEVLPNFIQWVKQMKTPVGMDKAKCHAQYFIKHHVDPVRAGSRGAVYDFFESLYEYYATHKILHEGEFTTEQLLFVDNMHTLSYGMVWAMEHDAFDVVKYDPIPTWGPDILRASM